MNPKTLQKKLLPATFDEFEAIDKKMAETNKKKADDLQIDFTKFQIPYYDWTLKFRKIIEGHENVLKYLPMWHKPYQDEHPWQFYCVARQEGKTTHAGGKLAYILSQMHKKATYVTFSDESLRSFSNDKFRGSILHPDNPELYAIIKGSGNDRGAVSRVESLSNSSVSLVTHANKMHHVIGKSNDLMVIDEVQSIDLDSFEEAQESQSWTQGDKMFAGVGGYIGTMHHKYWLSTNQMKYQFKKETWRDGLEFNSDGLVWDDYLIDLCAGDWLESAPKNWTRHGYWMPQQILPNIPLTIDDAINKYKVAKEYSIEYKRSIYSTSFYLRNVEAQFVKGQTKPFTKDMILRLFDRSLAFTRPEEVDHSKGRVYAVSDWGGGQSAYTVPMIAQCIHPTAPIFKILYITRLDEPDVERQADQFINLCNAYEVDKIGIDAGGGARQAQKTETTFVTRCTRISYRERPQQPLPTDVEWQKLESENRFSIDRSYSLERLKDMMDNPYQQGNYAFPRFIIPAADLQKVAWIADDFEAIEGELVKLKSTGQDYIRYDNPKAPDDAAHSFNYLWITQMLDQGSDVWLKTF